MMRKEEKGPPYLSLPTLPVSLLLSLPSSTVVLSVSSSLLWPVACHSHRTRLPLLSFLFFPRVPKSSTSSSRSPISEDIQDKEEDREEEAGCWEASGSEDEEVHPRESSYWEGAYNPRSISSPRTSSLKRERRRPRRGARPTRSTFWRFSTHTRGI